MKFKPLLCGLSLAGSLVATDAFAETGWNGYDLRVSVTAPIVDQHTKLDFENLVPEGYEHASDVWAGFGGTISLGYRWGVFGLYVDQDLGGVWWTGEFDVKPTVVGGTYLTFRSFLVLIENVEIDFGIGLGTMYSGGKAQENVLIFNKNFERSSAFAIRVGASLTYYVTKSIGVGINMDYSLGLNIFKGDREGIFPIVDDGTAGNGTVYHLVHHLTTAACRISALLKRL